MTTTGTRYTVRELTEADLPAALELMSASLAGGPTGERTAEFFAWKHQHNPFGPSPALVAEADERLVGLRMFLRWELTAGGRTLRAVRAVDTATHPDFQGQGIFKTLTLQALDTVAADADLVFNTPNSNSRPGYLKMGWLPVGDVPIAIRPVRPLRFLRGLRSASHSPTGDSAAAVRACPLPPAASAFAVPDELAALVDAAAATADPTRLRTRLSLDYLRWRYADAPALDYRAITTRSGGRLTGVAFARPRLRGTLTELTLSQLVTHPDDPRAAARLLRAAARSGCDHVATHLTPGTTAAAVGLRCGYLTAPGQGMTLVTNPRRPVTPDPTRLDSWQLSLGDLEVF
jgi:GNAT superfamily N-acetyltransferase